jgi:hypothetical protein
MKRYHRQKIVLWIICAVMAALISGCLGADKKDEKDESHLFFEEWKSKALKSKGYSPSRTKPKGEAGAKQPKAAPQEQLVVDVEKPLPKQKINMKMKDVEGTSAGAFQSGQTKHNGQ